MEEQIKWNLYEVFIEFCNLSRLVVFHDKENIRDSVQIETDNWQNLNAVSKNALGTIWIIIHIN